MKAAILEKLNAPLIVDEVKLPVLKYGQVLVKVVASTICGAQIGEITGAKGKDRFLPHLLGHEGCGWVVDVGQGVRHVKKGDHVVLHWRKGAGVDAEPPKYEWGNKTVGGGWVTTFNEYAVISENRLTPIPDDIPDSIGSLMGCAVTTALGLLNNEARLRIGESIAVAGCGGVGLNVIQGASLILGNPIIAIDAVNTKLYSAEMFGATDAIQCNDNPSVLSGTVRSLVGGKGVDVFVECTGSPAMIDWGYQIIAPGGRLILVGQPSHSDVIKLSHMRGNYCGKMVMDSQGGMTNPNVDIPRYLALYKRGKLKLDGLITHTFLLDGVNEAVELVKSGEAGRVLLEMSSAG